ncbi:MAG: uL15 family ribosomal protein [Candidatus Paceibacterota bacterium]|jgi:large subunit ribosomal protein L15
MQLHEIKRDNPLKKRKRIGRGGRKGTYSGRGMKGQNSRSGNKPRPALRDIVKKFPKKRGYNFAPVKAKPVILNLNILEKKFNAGEKVNSITLQKRKIIRKKDREIKILSNGEITKGLVFEGYITFSKTAKEKIEKAGGTINTKAKPRPTLPKAERRKIKRANKPAKPKKIEEVKEKVEVKKDDKGKKEKVVKVKEKDKKVEKKEKAKKEEKKK